MVGREHDDRGGWIAVPSVPPERIGQALLAFYVALAAAVAVDAALIVHNRGPVGWRLVSEGVFDDGGAIVAWALAATWPIMEVFRLVLASMLENWIRRRGIEQGRAETQRLWEAWNERRLQAEAKGEPFTEPPPGAIANGD